LETRMEYDNHWRAEKAAEYPDELRERAVRMALEIRRDAAGPRV